jgi:hypothetical protein
VFGVIILFIGLGVQPAFAVIPNIVEKNEENAIIQKIKNNIDRLKILLDDYKRYEIKSSNLNLEYKDKFQELYDEITTINEEVNNIKPNDHPILNLFYFLYRIVLIMVFYLIVVPIGFIIALILAPFYITIFIIYVIIVLNMQGPP